MTIAEWNLVLNSVMSGLMIGGGFWFKYVVEQQLKSKDTAIQALEGVVKLKDAHISSLQGDTAPAIAKAYSDMRKHADQITSDFNKASAKLAEIQERKLPHETALSQAEGLYLAITILRTHMSRVFLNEEGKVPEAEPDSPARIGLGAFLNAYQAMLTEVTTRMSKVKSLNNDAC
jgi:hypothetical protein